jgi:signal transduction histidine kinase
MGSAILLFVPDTKVPQPPLPTGLSESDALQHVARALGIGISIVDRDFRIIWTNHLVQNEEPEREDEGSSVIGAHCYAAYYGRSSICPGCLPLRSFETGEVYTAVSRRVGRDGQPRYLQITSVPIPGPGGTVEEVMELAMNVTESKLLEEQLAQAEKLALVGQMAAGFAHEIKNPLAGMKGAVRVLKGDYDNVPPEERAEVLAEIERQVDRLNRTVEDTLAFARPQKPVLARGNLNDVVSAVMRTVAADPSARDVHVHTNLAEQATGRFDGHLLEQLLLNLVQNALQALDGGGTIVIRTQTTGDMLSIEVEDGGPGMPAEVRRRAFEPFFTTKHRGTGLGLAIVQRIAEAHGGRALLESRPGGGTSVRVLLPQV